MPYHEHARHLTVPYALLPHVMWRIMQEIQKFDKILNRSSKFGPDAELKISTLLVDVSLQAHLRIPLKHPPPPIRPLHHLPPNTPPSTQKINGTLLSNKTTQIITPPREDRLVHPLELTVSNGKYRSQHRVCGASGRFSSV